MERTPFNAALAAALACLGALPAKSQRKLSAYGEEIDRAAAAAERLLSSCRFPGAARTTNIQFREVVPLDPALGAIAN